tara:strand:+ start:1196 stop:1855 length:660 start_codon:yes stop_codon:yes gene_type:complete
MAFYKQIEFAELIGKSRGWLNVYIKRKTIIMSGDFIDDKIEKNKKFLDKWISKKNEVKKIPVPKKKESVKTPGPKIPEPAEVKLKAPNIQEPKEIQITAPENDLDRQKKVAEIRFKNSQIEKNELQSAKLRGDSIPTSMVSGVVSTLGRSFQNAYRNGAEVLLLEMSHKAKLSSKLEAELKGLLIELINKSHADAITEAKTTIDTIVSDVAAVEADKKD